MDGIKFTFIFDSFGFTLKKKPKKTKKNQKKPKKTKKKGPIDKWVCKKKQRTISERDDSSAFNNNIEEKHTHTSINKKNKN